MGNWAAFRFIAKWDASDDEWSFFGGTSESQWRRRNPVLSEDWQQVCAWQMYQSFVYPSSDHLL
jgi:hypothetical protein